MANNPISMSKIRQIIRLYSQGVGKKKIALRLSVSKNTVKHYIDFYHSLQLNREEIDKLSDLELNNLFHPPRTKLPEGRLQQLYEYFPVVEKQLRRRGMTLKRLYQEYRSRYKEVYGATQFYRYYNLWSSKVSPSMVIHHKEGEQMYIDYAGAKLPYVDEFTGEIKKAEVFAGILGWSQYSYVEAVASQSTDDTIGAAENCLHYFGGSPQAMVTDNMKSAVDKASKYEPRVNENFAAFANHYGMIVLPARAYKPKDKSHVENLVKIIYQRIYACLPEHTVLTLKQLNAHILHQLELHNSAVLTGKTVSRKDQWELEKQSLEPLPEQRYELKTIKQVTVMKNGHVLLSQDKHYYSVPFELIGKKLSMHYTRSQVELYLNYELIAVHRRVRSPHNYSSEASHMAPQHSYVTHWSVEFFVEQARKIDPMVERYISQVLSKKQHPQQGYKACQGILMLGKKVGAQRLIKACTRAEAVGYYSYKAIDDILRNNLDQFDEDQVPDPMPSHENIRGAEYYR